MADRIQVDSGLQTPIVRPKERQQIVDTYVRPAAQNTLEQLAQGLGEISPEVRQFSQVISAQTAEAARAEGEAQARQLTDAGKSWAQATREGKVPNHMNPWFMAGYKEQFGRVAADTWKGDLVNAMDQQIKAGGLDSLDKFDQFAVQHRQQWLDQQIPADQRDQSFQLGFAHRSDAYFTDVRNQFIADLNSRTDKRADEAHFQETMNAIKDSKAKGLSADQIAADLNQLNNDAFAHGKRWEDINNASSMAIAEASHQLQDTDLLKALMSKVGPGKGGYASTTFGSKLLEKVGPEIDNAIHTQLIRQEQQQKYQEQQAEKDVFGSVIDSLVNTARDPMNRPKDLRPFMQKLVQAGGSANSISKLVELQKNMDSLSEVDNSAAKDAAFNRIWGARTDDNPPLTEAEIATMAFGERKSISWRDAAWMREQLKQRDETDKDQEKDIWNNYNYKQVVETIKSRFATMLGTDGDRRAHAEAELASRWAAYATSQGFSKTNYQQNIKWLEENAQQIVATQRGNSGLDKNSLFGEAPPATFVKPGEIPKTLLLTPDDIQALQGGKLTDNAKQQMDIFKIPAQMQGEFIKSQLRIYNQLKAKPKKEPAPNKE